MMVEQLNFQIYDLINQLEHAMFLSVESRSRLEKELGTLVEARDRARAAMASPNVRKDPPRRTSNWSKVY